MMTDYGTADAPLDSMVFKSNGDMNRLKGTWYVKVGGTVSIEGYDDGIESDTVKSVTSGMGLSVDNSTTPARIVGTISGRGNISIKMNYAIDDSAAGNYSSEDYNVMIMAMTVYGSVEEPVRTLDNVTLDSWSTVFVPMNRELTFTNVTIYSNIMSNEYVADRSDGISDFSQTSTAAPFDMTFKVVKEEAVMYFFLRQFAQTVTFVGVETSPLRVKVGGSWKCVKKALVKVSGTWKTVKSVHAIQKPVEILGTYTLTKGTTYDGTTLWIGVSTGYVLYESPVTTVPGVSISIANYQIYPHVVNGTPTATGEWLIQANSSSSNQYVKIIVS